MRDRSEIRTGYALLLPALAVMSLVALYPILGSFWLSLRHRVLPFGIDSFIGLDHFKLLVQTPRFWNSLGVTCYFAVVSVTLEVALGVGIALLLARKFRGVGWIRAVILLPWAIPTAVTAKSWLPSWSGSTLVATSQAGSQTGGGDAEVAVGVARGSSSPGTAASIPNSTGG